ncbi:hypothetical protein FE257_003798 [Aspergillus nanangensis]|uniref:C2H2-type domain-containing protein n=1 Tax=Aspergillus nanangensis TaxID=2582783 RepID=A0AAD4CCF3_ASPNN|nr:hypothetical protein FE257_003798 [Aspergillus nanangensis]
MDLFMHNDPYQVWICKPCQYAVCPQRLENHLWKHHRTHPTAATAALRQSALEKMRKRSWLDPRRETLIVPGPISPPIPYLPVYRGYRCTWCCYVVRSLPVLRAHISKTHPEQRRPRGHPTTVAQQANTILRDHPVSCQRFFPTGAGSQFFTVTPPAQVERTRQADTLSPEDFIRVQVERALEQDIQNELERTQQLPLQKHATEISPWLELTRWPEYLGSCDLPTAAAPGFLPNPIQEPLLAISTQGVGRRIKSSIRSGSITSSPSNHGSGTSRSRSILNKDLKLWHQSRPSSLNPCARALVSPNDIPSTEAGPAFERI